MKHLEVIQGLIAKGKTLHDISDHFKGRGYRVHWFGGYITVGKTLKERVCVYETDNGLKTHYVHKQA